MSGSREWEWRVYTLDEVKNFVIGPVGTPRRDKHEEEVSEELAIVLENQSKDKPQKQK